MTPQEADRILRALEALGDLGDAELNSLIKLARERLVFLWAEKLRAQQNAEDAALLFTPKTKLGFLAAISKKGE